MQEINIRLRFTSPCLGFAKKPFADGRKNVIFCMPRDGHGRVIFLKSWWHVLLHYAAKVAGICYNSVRKIDWAQPIDGELSEWRRIVVPANKKRKARYALHEAYRPGAVIGIRAVLPDSITIDDFTRLMIIVGSYKGISPYKCEDETYGAFEVVSVMPAIRHKVPRIAPKSEGNSTHDDDCPDPEIRYADRH